jgi:uncharacterized HAD superfamily protein
MKRTLKIQPHEIGFDLDGVIADTAEAFIRIACEKHDYCSFTSEDITNFELEECLGIPTDLVNSIFLEILLDSLSTGLQPMTGAVEVLGEISAHAPITVITARHLEKPVIDWFDNFFPGSTRNAIKLIAMGDHNDKLRYIQDHNLKYFIDDRAETCNMLAAANIKPLVFSHPWNRNRHNLPTVENWQEIRKLLAFEK